jgi:hypothetical protein
MRSFNRLVLVLVPAAVLAGGLGLQAQAAPAPQAHVTTTAKPAFGTEDDVFGIWAWMTPGSGNGYGANGAGSMYSYDQTPVPEILDASNVVVTGNTVTATITGRRGPLEGFTATLTAVETKPGEGVLSMTFTYTFGGITYTETTGIHDNPWVNASVNISSS